MHSEPVLQHLYSTQVCYIYLYVVQRIQYEAENKLHFKIIFFLMKSILECLASTVQEVITELAWKPMAQIASVTSTRLGKFVLNTNAEEQKLF